jgi:hypothetical protein
MSAQAGIQLFCPPPGAEGGPLFRTTRGRSGELTAHVTKKEKGRRSNLDRRTTRHPGYAISLSRRWLIEKSFGWLKQTGPVRQVKLRGLHKVDWLFVFSCAAHNLMRLPKLMALRRQARPVEQRA